MVTRQVTWHDERRARIRRSHPEVTTLYGPDPRTGLCIVVLVALHLVIARSLVGQPWIVWLLAVTLIGPTVAHALGVLIHEASHNLINRSPRANRLWLLVCNLPLGAPAAVEFRAQHSLHHRHLGDADGSDTQAPTRAEDAWVGNASGRKFWSFFLGRFFYKGRPANAVAWDGWMVANWITSFGVSIAVLVVWGGWACGYLVASSLLAFGPHTFGARRLSEHLPVRAEQPTNSYYGPLNWLSFNVGYHVEHHDFPNIAWTRLPKLKEMARDEYAQLFAFRSWTRLIVNYMLDARYRVGHYVGMGPVLGEDVARAGRTGCSDAELESGEGPGGLARKPYA
ncbi:MAG TPA: fatty acid desaturase [Polyangiaceae bacterium]|nr:fatty acid desaturase [Polyangiaceae bacterium]